MTRVTLIDAQTSGISGDMLLAALIDAGANTRLIQNVLDLIPLHYPKCKALRLKINEKKTHGFRAREVVFELSEGREEARAETMIDAARRIAEASGLSRNAVVFATNSVKELVDTEIGLHGVGIAEAHLHETGSADTLADVFGVAAASDSLGIFEGDVLATPVAIGGGRVSFSHGSLGIPAPAALEIIRKYRIPILGGPEKVELATPTGLSLLANLAKEFVETYPAMIPEVVGYGAGKMELTAGPNLLRVVIGRGLEQPFQSDMVQILETNLDDLPGEILSHALQRILESGAKDAWITSAQFKKGRPGHLLHVICDPQDAQRLAGIMMDETGTLGVRYQRWNRFTLEREVRRVTVKIAGKSFDVRVKFAKHRSGKIVRIKPEFDDIQAIAKETSLTSREITDIVIREAQISSEKVD